MTYFKSSSIKANSSPTDFASDGVSCARKDEDDQEMQALMKEQEYLEKWKSENAPDFQW